MAKTVKIDLRDHAGVPAGGAGMRRDRVTVWAPTFRPATGGDWTVGPQPVDYFFEDGVVNIPDVDAGPLVVRFDVDQMDGVDTFTVTVPTGDGVVTMRELLADHYEYAPIVITEARRVLTEARVLLKQSQDSAASAKTAQGAAKVSASAAASSASAAKSSQDAAAASASSAQASETNAKQSETNAGDYAAVATTAATEAVDAMERATDLAGGDFATHEYVDQKVSSVALTGTWSPEGRVTAPVGSVYTDSAATNGAIRWIKASGTGNTGWSVQYGDTGWRSITIPSLDSGDSAWVIRRVGDVVTLRIADPSGNILLAKTTDNTVTPVIPWGFWPSAVVIMDMWKQSDNTANGFLMVQPAGFINLRAAAAVLTRVSQMTWVTSTPWPTSLPGTPV